MTEAIARDQLRSIFRRWQDIEARKTELGDESKDLFTEAKGNGYEPKALRAAFRQIVKDEAAEADPEKAELQAVIDLYVDALKYGAAVEPSRVSAPARVEIIAKSPANSRSTTGEGGSGSYERPNVEIKAGPRPGDEDVPDYLRRGHPANSWVRQ